MESEHSRDTASSALSTEPEVPKTPIANIHPTPLKSTETNSSRLNVIESIDSPIPLRRSPRNSIAPVETPHLGLEDVLNGQASGVGTPASRSGTPDNDVLVQDGASRDISC